jgi:hypothetical protein
MTGNVDELWNLILDVLDRYGELHQDMIVKKIWYEWGLKKWKAETITRKLRKMAEDGVIERDFKGNYWR